MKTGSIVRWRGELYRVVSVGRIVHGLESLDNGQAWVVRIEELELVEGVQAIAGIRTEVCRSFAYKLNVSQYGGPQYESRDFFASQKAECSMADAEEVGAALYAYCRAQVLASVKEYIAEMRSQRDKMNQDHDEPYVYQERKGRR